MKNPRIAVRCCSVRHPHCFTPLPYPAPQCGHWLVECDECPFSVIITAAGRADDPISVRVACPRKLSCS